MSHLRLASLLALGALLIPASALAQEEKGPRIVRLDEGITVRISPLWQSHPLAQNGATKLELIVSEGTALRMAVYFTVEKRRDASDALQRVADIVGPPGPQDRHFLVNGWPAIEATRMIDVPRVNHERDEKAAQETAGQGSRENRQEPRIAKFERTMTAIAAADRTVIIEQRLYDVADARLREAGRELVNGLTFTRGGNEGISKTSLDDIDYVRKNLYDRSSLVDYIGNNFGFLTEVTTTKPVLAQNGVGEIAMAASTNGVKVAIASNSGWAKSSDSGGTYTGGNNFPAALANTAGDPALAYGAKTDNFYLGYLGRPNGGGGTGNTVNGCTVSVDRSRDGQNYAFAAHVRFCAASAAVTTPPTLMCMPDQEHIAADPVRSRARGVTPRNAPKDQVYVAWRQFTAVATAAVNTCAKLGSGNTVVELACSQDNGATWTAPLILGTGSDRARVAVGPDGFVYVAYSVQQSDSAGGFWNQIYLDKYSSCKTGFVQQWGYPRTVVANARPQSCGASTPGLDRCSGDLMNSHTVTVSDFNTNGMVFVVYSDGTAGVTTTNKGTDRVIAAILPNGGFNVASTHLLSDGGTPGRKFLPWACTEGKNLYATWYDRRAATAAAPDLTDYYAGWLKLDKSGPTVHNNINLTGNADAQCKSGWPFGTDNQASGTSCPTPKQPGVCQNNTTGNFTTLCDFSGTPACAAGSTCQNGGGAPKYGDYNANACAAGRLYAAWTSATTPAGAPAAPAGLNTFTRTVQPRVP